MSDRNNGDGMKGNASFPLPASIPFATAPLSLVTPLNSPATRWQYNSFWWRRPNPLPPFTPTPCPLQGFFLSVVLEPQKISTSESDPKEYPLCQAVCVRGWGCRGEADIPQYWVHQWQPWARLLQKCSPSAWLLPEVWLHPGKSRRERVRSDKGTKSGRKARPLYTDQAHILNVQKGLKWTDCILQPGARPLYVCEPRRMLDIWRGMRERKAVML